MAIDEHGRRHPDVGTGAESFWHWPTNRYPGCTCPPWRYNPRHPKPTNPDCPTHGDHMCSLQEHIEREKRERETAKTKAAQEAAFSSPEQDAE